MSWDSILLDYKNSDFYKNLWQSVEIEYENHLCFPPKDQVFRALELTPFHEVKVVILGQDPYHNPKQANGLSFSASNGIKTPASLRNIYTELINDLGIIKTTNELDSWAKQGVLLLNSTLTVRAYQPNSHKHLGWEKFTDYIIKILSNNKENLVFVLWGNFAQKKKTFINTEKHLIISGPHPSPLSAHRGFFGSKPFSTINNFLKNTRQNEIEW